VRKFYFSFATLILIFFAQFLILGSVAAAINNDLTRPLKSEVRFSGFYLGANIGKQVTLTNLNSSLNVIVPGTVNVTLPIDSNENDPSLLLGVSLGYATLLHDLFYIGIEGRFDSEDLSPTEGVIIRDPVGQTKFDANTELSLNWNYILFLKPGFLLSSHTLLYGMLGISLALFTINTTAEYFQNVGFGLHSGNISNIKRVDKLGIVLGIGVEQYLSKSFSVKLEGDYLHYGTVVKNESFTKPVTGIIANSTITMTNNFVDVDMYKILIGVIYHFR